FENFGRGVSGTINLIQAVGPAAIATTAGIGVLTAAMIATRNATTLAGRAMIIFRGVLTAVSRHPIIFAITGIVAGLTAIGTAMGVFNKNTEDTVDPAKEIQEALDNYSPPIRAATEETGKFRKQLSKID